MPGARSWCTVVTKLMPVRIDDMPSTNTARMARGTLTAVRRLKGT